MKTLFIQKTLMDINALNDPRGTNIRYIDRVASEKGH